MLRINSYRLHFVFPEHVLIAFLAGNTQVGIAFPRYRVDHMANRRGPSYVQPRRQRCQALRTKVAAGRNYHTKSVC
jgi:hypothetical protein